MMRLWIFTLIIIAPICSDAQQWEWGQHSPGELSYNSKCIDQDAASNLYIAGTFTGNISLGNIILSSSNKTSYVAKVDPNGNYLWAKKLNCNINDLVVDNDITIAGSFSDSINIDQSTLVSQGASDALLLKLDLAGNLIWTKQGKGSGEDQFNSIHKNTSGDIVVLGTTDNAMQINSVNFTKGASIVKISSQGIILSNINIGPTTRGWEISSDINNNIYVLCMYSDSIVMKGEVYYADYYGSHFLAKYSSSGNFLWINDLGGNYYSHYENLKVTKNGDSYLSMNHRYSAFNLLKFSSSGVPIWDKYFGGSVYDNCFDLELDSDENICMTGGFWYSASYGGISVSGTENCLFFAKIDSTGQGILAKSVTVDSQGFIYGMETSFKNSGHGYLIGFSNGNSHLDSYPVEGRFIAKLSLNSATPVETVSKNDDHIILFPNPSNGIFTIDITKIKEKNKHITVYDINGKCVYEQKYLTSDSSITIDLKNLPKGIYSVELIADKKKWIKKLIVN